MTERVPVPRLPRRASRTPSMTANLELVDGSHVYGIAGDYIRHPEPVQPERQVA